jgi:hypothetical protein
MRFQAPISVVIAIAFGLVVLLGYFLDMPLLTAFKNVFVQWALMLAAVALLVGVANLFSVHWRKARRREKGATSSLVLLISLLVTILVTGYFGPTGSWTMWIFNYVQVPLETSLMALLAIVLVYAIAKLFGRRVDLFTLIFIGTALVVLLGTAPLFGVELPGIHGPNGIKYLIAQIPAVGGARGILIGVALGTLATGLRILLGADRPYGG